MNIKLFAGLLAAVLVSLSLPAFASGYGPAPFYRPSVGAPASQRGQSAQTVSAERNGATRAPQETGVDVAGGSVTGNHQAAPGSSDIRTAY
jgi:hypothetical protein